MNKTAKYAAANRPTSDDPRDVEAWALGEAARRLAVAARDPEDIEGLQSALQLNQRLWTIFQAAITEDDCQMPQGLRTNVAALSLLVDRETMARLVDLDVTKLDTLININRNVAGGLATKIEGAPQGAAASAAAPQAAAPAFQPHPPVGNPALAGLGRAAPAPAAGKEAPQTPRESLRISI